MGRWNSGCGIALIAFSLRLLISSLAGSILSFLLLLYTSENLSLSNLPYLLISTQIKSKKSHYPR